MCRLLLFLSRVRHSSIRCPFLLQELQWAIFLRLGGCSSSGVLYCMGLGGGVRLTHFVEKPDCAGCMIILMSAEGRRWRSVCVDVLALEISS